MYDGDRTEPRQSVIHPTLMAGIWARQLGERHRAHANAAATAAEVTRQRADAMGGQCLKRWPGIVAAMTTLVDEYNGGFDQHTVVLVEDRTVAEHQVITIQADGDRHPPLSAALDGTTIYLATHNGHGGSFETQHEVRPDRTDEELASYVLQHWMERL